MEQFRKISDRKEIVTGRRQGLSSKVLHLLFCLILVPAALFFGSCAEVPITHREGLHLVPESQLLTLSFQQYEQVLKTSKLSSNQNKTHMVRTVGEKVAKSAEAFLKDSGGSDKTKDYHWEFNLIEDDKTVNAWCMPGGKVGVYTGILPYAQDENGLAVILGHEIGHAIADHGNERMSQALLAEMGGMALSAALSQKPRETQDLFMAVFGVGVSVGALLPYSRLHESEADRIGLMLMARAGYDPRESIPFWERMSKERKAAPPEFLSTHPAPESRIENLKSYIPEALPYYKKGR
ncbi:MAG: zn-dependent protease with chaperone function [Deltaproteobacteria bacterium]|jgi:predicted Zn-dependent protease|nr:zn-dependent protease with chaperone function [Deltaproteobacteria bacterium]